MPSKKLSRFLGNEKARTQLFSGVVIALMVISAFTGLFLMSERASAAWDTPGDYSHHYKITINNGGSALTNFQIKVILNSSNINYSYWQSNGYDTLFTNATNTTNYNFYMESWNTSGDSIFWVNVTSVPNGNSVMYMHCGQSEISSDHSNFDGTFTKSYAGDSNLDVEWLLDDGTGTTAADTSGNNANGTLVGGATWVGAEGGQWDGQTGVTFSTGDSIQLDTGGEAVTDNGQLAHPTNGTWEVWYKHLGAPPGTYDGYVVYCDAGDNNDGDAGILLDVSNSSFYGKIEDGATTYQLWGGTPSVGQWYYLVLTLNNGEAKFYVNGELKDSATTSASSLGNDLRNVSLGNYYNSDWALDGIVDSFRQYSRVLSQNEIQRHYYDTKYASTEPTLTITEFSGNSAPTCSITSPSNGATVSGTVSIQGTASDSDGTVQSVQVKIGSDAWADASGTTSWTFSWDTTGYSDGNYTILARSYDGTDYSTEDSITVTVDNVADTDPSVALSGLTSGKITWNGTAPGSYWCNATGAGHETLNIAITGGSGANDTDVTQINITVPGDLTNGSNSIDPSAITLYVSVDNSTFHDMGAFPTNGGTIVLNATTWTWTDDPFPISGNNNIYCRFKITYADGQAGGTYTKTGVTVDILG